MQPFNTSRGLTKDGEKLVARTCIDSTSSNGFKPEEGGISLPIRKKLVTMRAIIVNRNYLL